MGKGQWNPWRGSAEFRQQLDRLFEEFAQAEAGAGYQWTPLADVLETAEAYVAQVELPGVSAEQVVVEIVEGDLVVRGERPCDRACGCEDVDHQCYRLMERAHGPFARRFPLPPDACADGVVATLNAGLLVVTVPKRPFQGVPKRSVPVG